MRSDAKASTAGSNRRNQLGSLALPASLFAALVALVVVVGNASAANGVVNFFGGEGATGGKFSSSSSGPGGIAVNQNGSGGATAGDVYVVDRGNRRVQQFEADGSFVRAFGRDVGGAGVHVCEVAASCVQAAASAEAAGMNTPQGVAIDQVTGNVFISDQSNLRIDVFSAEGAFQGAFGYGVDTGAAALEFCTTASTCQAGSSGANAGQFGTQLGYLAVAPAGSPHAGDLYVADKSNRRVDRFTPELTGEEVTGASFVDGFGWGVDDGAAEFQHCTTVSVCQSPNTSSPTTNPGQFSSNQPVALALDSEGNIYAAESSGNSRVQKFDSEGEPAPFAGAEVNGSPGPVDLTVDPTTDHLFVLKEPSGAGEKRVLELNAGGAFLATHASSTKLTSVNGLAVVDGTTNFYVSSATGFEPNYDQQAGRYLGVFFLGTRVNPTASTEAPSPLASHTATLKGKVNPKGFTTHYRFEFSADNGKTWVKYPEEENKEVNLGNGEADIPVEQEVSGLVGGHSYRSRIVATKPWGAGTVTSNTTTFVAPAAAPQVEAFTTAVTTKAAVLNANINPNNQATTYHFEWGSADCSANPCTSVPAVEPAIGAGEIPFAVAKEIDGLAPDNTYHYRVLATNATGTTEGPDQTFRTFPLFVPETDCPNQQFRTGASARLPDCRAYEIVSPLDKNGASITARQTSDQAALDGDKMAYTASDPFGDALFNTIGQQYIASRGANGWTTHAINPLHEQNQMNNSAITGVPHTAYSAFSEDLSLGFLHDSARPPLTEDALPNNRNYYLRDNLNETYTALSTQLFTPRPAKNDYNSMGLQGWSADYSHTLLAAQASFTADAKPTTTQYQLYDFHDGELELVSILPNGEPVLEAMAGGSRGTGGGVNRRDPGQEGAQNEHAISDDGSRIFWTSAVDNFHETGKLYVRIDGETTIPVSESVSATDNAVFWTAAADGSQVIFTTDDPAGGRNAHNDQLYRFDVDSETPTLIAGEVEWSSAVLGASEDASEVYFISLEDLAPGASAGEPNLYLDDEGTKTFIATLAARDAGSGETTGSTGVGTEGPTASVAITRDFSRVTSDGRHLVFQSRAPLTGYDNTSADTGEAAVEIFTYDAVSDEIECVSCNPSGARPRTRTLADPYVNQFEDAVIEENSSTVTAGPAAAWLPTPRRATHIPRMIAEDGSYVFFNANDALVPYDINGVQDVYKWTAQGTGGCEREGGCIRLISTGVDEAKATFIDASGDGGDVFFRTAAGIDPDDEGNIDIYDARAGGGFPRKRAAVECFGDACQNVPEPPVVPTPASAATHGPGDPVPVGNCSQQARRAAQLARRAKTLRKRAKRVGAPKRTRALRKRADAYSKRAKALSKRASRCRRANRRASR